MARVKGDGGGDRSTEALGERRGSEEEFLDEDEARKTWVVYEEYRVNLGWALCSL